MFRLIKLGSVIISLLFVNSVFASPQCTTEPENKWMGMHDMQKKIINDYGFTIKLFKVDDNCYEIYGWQEKRGKVDKIEVYFNPVNGDIVKKVVD